MKASLLRSIFYFQMSSLKIFIKTQEVFSRATKINIIKQVPFST